MVYKKIVIAAIAAGMFLTCSNPNALDSPAVRITSVSTSDALPTSRLEITGSGLGAVGTFMVRFSDTTGYQIDIQPVESNATKAIVCVPPYIITGTKQFGSGIVSIQIVQGSGSGEVLSNSIKGFHIQDLPVSVATPGWVTLNFLTNEINYYTELQAGIKGTLMDSPALTAAIATNKEHLTALIAQIQGVVTDKSASFSLGTIKGTDVAVGVQGLLQSDRLILGMLTTLKSTDFSSLSALAKNRANAGLTGACQAEADAYSNDMINFQGGLDPSYQRCVAQNPVDVISRVTDFITSLGNTAIGILSLVGVPAASLALPSAALLYVGVMSAGTELTIGAALKNVNNEAALKALQNGVDQTEELFTDPIVGKVVSDVFSETVGTMKDLYDGITSIIKEVVLPTSICTFALSSKSKQILYTGGSGTVEVTAGSGCVWTAISGVSWIFVAAGIDTGNGTVNYAVQGNASPLERSGIITIAGTNFIITQAGSIETTGPFDGSWEGSWTGVFTYADNTTWSNTQSLLLAIDNGAIRTGSPMTAKGTVDISGNATWITDTNRVSLNNTSCYVFTGAFLQSGSASGTWTFTNPANGTTGLGTWKAILR